MPFQADLTKIGLSDKEAAVYQAALGLGPSPAQPIARTAKVARGTTYLVLEALMEMGLITRYVEGKKTLFVAAPPEQLKRLLEKQAEEIEEHQDNLGKLLPQLRAFMKAANDQPVVRYYDGIEGLRAMRSEMTRYSKPGDVWYNLTPVDYLQDLFGEEGVEINSRVTKGIKLKAIFTTHSDELRESFLSSMPRGAQRKFVSPKKYRHASGMTIYRDRVAIGTFAGKIGGIVIESESVVGMMRDWFDLLWENLD